jgi:hypothetical protein
MCKQRQQGELHPRWCQTAETGAAANDPKQVQLETSRLNTQERTKRVKRDLARSALQFDSPACLKL